MVYRTERIDPDPEPGPFSARSLRAMIKLVGLLLLVSLGALIVFVVLQQPVRWSVAALITALVLGGVFKWMHEEIKSAQYRADARGRERADKEKPSVKPEWQVRPSTRPMEPDWEQRRQQRDQRKEPPGEQPDPPY